MRRSFAPVHARSLPRASVWIGEIAGASRHAFLENRLGSFRAVGDSNNESRLRFLAQRGSWTVACANKNQVVGALPEVRGSRHRGASKRLRAFFATIPSNRRVAARRATGAYPFA